VPAPTSFRDRLQLANEALAAEQTQSPSSRDPWLVVIKKLSGSVGPDGVARITSAEVMDVLQVPLHQRRTDKFQRVGQLMASCGWEPTRINGQSSSVDGRLRGWARQITI
jgi:hypothetical protein